MIIYKVNKLKNNKNFKKKIKVISSRIKNPHRTSLQLKIQTQSQSQFRHLVIHHKVILLNCQTTKHYLQCSNL